MSYIKNWYNHCHLPPGINETLITLIPKKNLETMGDLRPIALCNVVYKIFSKVLANRLKPLLSFVISESRSDFLEGRLITDNILLVFKATHYLKRKSQGKDDYMTLKLDMSKAYDHKWIELISIYISSVSYKVVHGSHSVGPIIPSRGLRQGDPLYPYLFILCLEGLLVLMRRYEVMGRLHGFRVARKAPAIMSLLFADDSLCFVRLMMMKDRLFASFSLPTKEHRSSL